MNWTAIVPIKPPAARKTRLTGMDADARLALTDRMLTHVVAVLKAAAGVGRVVLLSNESHGRADWISDEGRGLNAELEAARAVVGGDVLVIHADLPLLTAQDVGELLAIADRSGAALAPDRHGTGTNALALRTGLPFAFRFGPDSCARHRAQLSDSTAVLLRPGLATDIDTAEDMVLAGLAPD